MHREQEELCIWIHHINLFLIYIILYYDGNFIFILTIIIMEILSVIFIFKLTLVFKINYIIFSEILNNLLSRFLILGAHSHIIMIIVIIICVYLYYLYTQCDVHFNEIEADERDNIEYIVNYNVL